MWYNTWCRLLSWIGCSHWYCTRFPQRSRIIICSTMQKRRFSPPCYFKKHLAGESGIEKTGPRPPYLGQHHQLTTRCWGYTRIHLNSCIQRSPIPMSQLCNANPKGPHLGHSVFRCEITNQPRRLFIFRLFHLPRLVGNYRAMLIKVNVTIRPVTPSRCGSISSSAAEK